MSFRRFVAASRALITGGIAVLCTFPALAADLTIGLGTDVTALDPHYHNVTPNNNVAAHIFGYLVQRNEKSQLEPGLATEWKTVDPLTWEFKLRKGVKFHDGSDFTAPTSSSPRSSACPPCPTVRRRSLPTRSRSRKSRSWIPTRSAFTPLRLIR